MANSTQRSKIHTFKRLTQLTEQAGLNYRHINTHLAIVRAANMLSCSNMTFDLLKRVCK